jgi:hypothetical protein
LNVLTRNRIALNKTLHEDGNNRHIQRFVSLKNWARAHADRGRPHHLARTQSN